MKHSKTKIFLAGLWGAVFLIFISIFFSTGLSLKEFTEQLREQIMQAGGWAPVLYVLFYAVRSVIFFPASLLTILSGMMFGPWLGLLLTMVGENISANISYIIGKYFLPDAHQSVQNKHPIFCRVISFSKANGFLTVLFARLGYVPFDLVGYCSGICNIKQRDFALGTFVGTIPGLLSYTLLGSSAVDSNLFLVSVSIFIASVAMAIFLKKFMLIPDPA